MGVRYVLCVLIHSRHEALHLVLPLSSVAQVMTMWMRGAFEAALPVQPVAIRYPHYFFNHLMALDSMLWHFFRVSCQLINFQSLEYLPVYVIRWNRVSPSVCELHVSSSLKGTL
jgi:hypothetical protein